MALILWRKKSRPVSDRYSYFSGADSGLPVSPKPVGSKISFCPPGLFGGVYFVQNFLEYAIDMRPDGLQDSWFLVVDAQEQPVTVQWAAPQLPTGATLAIEEVDEQQVAIPA